MTRSDQTRPARTCTVGVYEAKTQLSRLLERVERGERITITRHGRPVAVLSSSVAATKETGAAIEELLRFSQDRVLGLTGRDAIAEGRR